MKSIKFFSLGFVPTIVAVAGLAYAGVVNIPGFCVGGACDKAAATAVADSADSDCTKAKATAVADTADSDCAKAKATGVADAKDSDCAKDCAKKAELAAMEILIPSDI